MPFRIDNLDKKILLELQRDASQALEKIARNVNSSKTPVWNRIRKMQKNNIIKKQTVVLNADVLGYEACFFVLIRTSEHGPDWQAKFLDALRDKPEIQEAHRLAGEIDYILKVRVKNAKAYDSFYQNLISDVNVHSVSALLSMEELKAGNELPLQSLSQDQ